MGTGQTVHGRCLQSPGSHQEAQRGQVACPRAHSTAARRGPRAGPPGAAGWSPGLVKEKEGAGLCLPGRERSLTSGDHVIGGDAGPRSHRAVLHDLISWLSPSAVPGAWNQYLLAGPEAPVSSCRPLPDGPPQQHTDPPPASRSQAGSQGRSRAAGDCGLRPALLPSAPRGCALCQWEEAVSVQIQTPPHLLPAGQHTRPPWGSGAHTSMRVMDPACRVAVEFHRPTRHLANSSAQ